MKLGNQFEYVINLCNPFVSITGATPAAVNSTLSTNTNYVAATFIPHYDLQINRIAVAVQTSSVQNVVAGVTTSNASGFPNNDPNNLTFINSGSSTSHSNATYTQFTITDSTLTKGTIYHLAAQVQTFTNNITFQNSFSNGTMSNQIQFPYITQRTGTTSVKVTGQNNLLCGYNNGTYTQWYGLPNVSSGTAQNLITTAGKQLNSAGCKFRLPLAFIEYKISAVGIVALKNPNTSFTCQIFDSDNSTQITNASSTVEAAWSADVSVGIIVFYFGGYVTLKPNKDYYLKISANGTVSATPNANVYYNRINGASLTTSNSTNAEFMNAYDVVNNYSVTSTSNVYTEYDNARFQAWLYCASMVSSFRGTKENGYTGF